MKLGSKLVYRGCIVLLELNQVCYLLFADLQIARIEILGIWWRGTFFTLLRFKIIRRVASRGRLKS